jgi:hypothetical protein
MGAALLGAGARPAPTRPRTQRCVRRRIPAPSSSGLGRRPLKAVTAVRIRSGLHPKAQVADLGLRHVRSRSPLFAVALVALLASGLAAMPAADGGWVGWLVVGLSFLAQAALHLPQDVSAGSSSSGATPRRTASRRSSCGPDAGRRGREWGRGPDRGRDRGHDLAADVRPHLRARDGQCRDPEHQRSRTSADGHRADAPGREAGRDDPRRRHPVHRRAPRGPRRARRGGRVGARPRTGRLVRQPLLREQARGRAQAVGAASASRRPRVWERPESGREDATSTVATSVSFPRGGRNHPDQPRNVKKGHWNRKARQSGVPRA